MTTEIGVPAANRRLKVLICGGGIAGPALAFWLARAGHRVTVVERFRSLRDTGAQIDLRGQGIEVVKRMGLLDAIRSRLVDEAGVAFVDANGNVKATILANTSGQGAQTMTSEYEIMRGDIVRLLYEATRDDVEYIFGQDVEHFTHDQNAVVARFSDGSSERFDLLVGADGQGSRVREAIRPIGAATPYRKMGMHMAYFFIPRTADDTNIRRTYHAPRGRMIMRRSHSPGETQVYFTLREDSEEAAAIHRRSVEQQKDFWRRRFKDAGWQIDRFLEGMKDTANFYSQEVVQVRIDGWSRGHVVLLGDAAHCPSPFSGMGTSGSLVGAYVLAGEIQRSPNDLPAALTRYEDTLRPFVREIQNINPTLLRLGVPQTQLAIDIFHFISSWTCKLRVPELVARFSKERDGGWKLPQYSELPSAQ